MKRLVLIAALCVAGCSFATPRDVGKANMFPLRPITQKAAGTDKGGVLMVAFPTAPSDLDTYRIAVTREDGRQDYIADARWSDFLPATLRAPLLDTLRNGGAFSYVEPDDGGVASQYVLHTQINKFTAVYPAPDKPPRVDVSVTFNLRDTAGGTVFRFTSERRAVAKENSMSAIADAFAQGFFGIERDLNANVSKANLVPPSEETHVTEGNAAPPQTPPTP